ncbi:MAG: FG-GAP-like repeat-containing protein [Planctomycetes bacterium]|nr:FG-GAP-like repeat-containing protein [Planctomycetota bacterium]
MVNSKIQTALFAFAAILFSGCWGPGPLIGGIVAISDGGSSDSSSAAAAPTLANAIQGTVVKGPVSAGIVKIYELNADGTPGTLLTTASTGSDGTFTADIGGFDGAIFISVSSGTYIDEASGETIDISASDSALELAITAGERMQSAGVAVTPVTTIASTRARQRMASGAPADTAIAESNAEIANHFGLTNITGTAPADARAGGLVPGSEAANYAAVLAGISQEARDIQNQNAGSTVTSLDFVKALASDFEDGVFDGNASGSVVIIGDQTGVNLSANATMADLATSIGTYFTMTNTISGVTAEDLAPLRETVTNASSTPSVPAVPIPALRVRDVTSGSSEWTNSRDVRVHISNDAGVTAWHLTETQNYAPAATDSRWKTTEPTSFVLTPGDGEKTLYLWVRTSAGVTNSGFISSSITLDAEPPTIAITSPTAGTQLSGGSSETISWSSNSSTGTVKVEFSTNGETFSGIADDVAIVGAYDWKVPQVDSTICQIRLTATDPAGNSASTTSAVFGIASTAPSAPEVNAVASPTKMANVTLSGVAGGNSTIRANVGSATFETTSSAAGSWSLEITLAQNSVNEISVVVIDGLQRISEPTTLSVTHDGVVADPVVDGVTSPTTATQQMITGTAEAGAAVSVSVNAAAAIVATASAQGDWNALVTLSQEQTNTISVTATDAAGNVSNAVVVTITHSSSGTPLFVASGVSASGDYAQGANIWIGKSISNTGSAPGACAFSLYLSADQTITTSDYLVYSGVTANIAAGAADEEIIQTGTVPASILSGNYYVGLIVTDTSAGTPVTASSSGNPVRIPWSATSTESAPDARYRHSAVWTGAEMIVWGGSTNSSPEVYANTGAKYNPDSNAWTAISTEGAPSARYDHAAVWTGSKMIIWGGYNGSPLGDGAAYDPASDSWSEISTANAPEARYSFASVWTGSRMIVWGGGGSTGFDGFLNSGGIYDPETNSWTTTTDVDAPSGRKDLASVWTGSRMIVWGGFVRLPENSFQDDYTNTGGVYDPVTDSWAATSTVNAPDIAAWHRMVWTGSKMIVFGGRYGESASPDWYNVFSAGIYDPSSDTWASSAQENSNPTRESPSLVWTGNRMLTWGGSYAPDVGWQYDLAADSWTQIFSAGQPSIRNWHSTIWTGSKMIVWGGTDDSGATASGGLYSPGISEVVLPSPSVNALPAATNENPITVSGVGVDGATITIAGGADVATTTAGSNGAWSVSVNLSPDASNTLNVMQTVDGFDSSVVVVVIVHDNQAPVAPTVTSSPPAQTTDTSVTLSGTAEPGGTITVTGGAQIVTIAVDSSGNWTLIVELAADQVNDLQITITDAAGNVSDAFGVQITHSTPTAPVPVVNSVTTPTNQNPITVTGTGAAGEGITITGGTQTATISVDGSGNWSVLVDLSANAQNNLSVTQTVAGIVSDAVAVSVTHDSIGPDAPVVTSSPPASTTLQTLALSGTAEVNAAISVTGGAQTANATVNSSGAWSVDVTLIQDAINNLAVIATDAAGNGSDAATITITQQPAAQVNAGQWVNENVGISERITQVYGITNDALYAVADGGRIFFSTGDGTWTEQTSGTTAAIHGTWGPNASDVTVVGASGTMLHTTGDGTWTPQASGTTTDLSGNWGTSANDVYNYGSTGVLMHFDGSAWNAQVSGTTNVIRDMWSTDASNVFFVADGSGTIANSTGDGNWTSLPDNTTQGLFGIWGSGTSDIYAVGNGGTILHSTDNGQSWIPQTSGTTNRIWKIRGYGANNYYAVGSGGTILHSTGDGTWTTINVGVTTEFRCSWVTSTGHVYVVGNSGSIFHYYPASVNPASGTQSGGTPVMITGSGFQVAGTTNVTFGGTSASQVMVHSTNALTCVVPAGASASTVDVVVTNPDSTTLSIHSGYTYVAPQVMSNAGNFTDISSSSGLSSDSFGTTGVSWGDFDGDDDLDLLICNPDGNNGLYRNDGGTLVAISGSNSGRTAPFADFDGDGDLDIFMTREQSAAQILLNDGAGSFSAVSSSVGIDDPSTTSNQAAWADYDLDGDFDVFVTVPTGANRFYRNDGGTFTNVASSLGMASSIRSVGATWGDYDNDGDPDLFLANDFGNLDVLYRNDSGSFTNVASSAGVSGASNSTGCAFADFDNDGDLDLLVTRYNATSFVYQNSGDGTFTQVNGSMGITDTFFGDSVSWGDYDNDGDQDTMVANRNGQNALYRNDGSAFTRADTAVGLTSSHPTIGASWGDINSDGNLDIAFGNHQVADELWQSGGFGGNYIYVRCLTDAYGNATDISTEAKFDAIGARIDVNLDNDADFPLTSGRTLRRDIESGTGGRGESKLIAHLGIGTTSTVSVRVTFVDGTIVMYTDVAANQKIVIRDR